MGEKASTFMGSKRFALYFLPLSDYIVIIFWSLLMLSTFSNLPIVLDSNGSFNTSSALFKSMFSIITLASIPITIIQEIVLLGMSLYVAHRSYTLFDTKTFQKQVKYLPVLHIFFLGFNYGMFFVIYTITLSRFFLYMSLSFLFLTFIGVLMGIFLLPFRFYVLSKWPNQPNIIKIIRGHYRKIKYNKFLKNEEKKLPIEAKKGGFITYQQWLRAQNAGFTSAEDFKSAQQGRFVNYAQWQLAKQEGFNTLQELVEWQHAQTTGFINKDEWLKAKQAGFTNYKQWKQASEEGFNNKIAWDEWQHAQTTGFTNKDEWLKAKQAGFTNYKQWKQASEEGFNNKVAWDEWQEAKQMGFLNRNVFYEAKEMGFYNYTDYLEAKKGRFTSYMEWKLAKQWNITSQEEWDYIKLLELLDKEEYEIFKELRKKLVELLEELRPNDEITIIRIKEVIAKDYGYDLEEINKNSIFYKGLTIKEFENILEKVIKDLITNEAIYKYSRLKDTLIKVDQSKSIVPTIKQDERTVSEFQCTNCHNIITKTSTFCPDCGYKIPRCEICKMPMLQEDQQGSCPHCKNSFHLSHFKEMVKIRGFCPLCKQEVKDHEIIITTVK